jgi:hypothetical protein
MNCVYPHVLTEKLHGNILGSLINLDLDALTKAFRVYCQTKVKENIFNIWILTFIYLETFNKS